MPSARAIFLDIDKYGSGISVFVGEDQRDTAARYFLKSPAEVATFLGMLLEQTQENFSWLKQSKIQEDTLDENPIYRRRSCSPS